MAKGSQDTKPARRPKRAARQEDSGDERSGYRQKIRAKKLAEGNKSKDGCSRQLMVLSMPFVAVAAYWLLKS